jgi:hypothetical protein
MCSGAFLLLLLSLRENETVKKERKWSYDVLPVPAQKVRRLRILTENEPFVFRETDFELVPELRREDAGGLTLEDAVAVSWRHSKSVRGSIGDESVPSWRSGVLESYERCGDCSRKRDK